MSRSRRKKRTPSLFDLVLPVVGFLALVIVFVPGVRQLLTNLLYLAGGLLVVVVLGLISWKIWRRNRPPEEGVVAQSAPISKEDWRGISFPSKRTNAYQEDEPRWTQELLSELEWKRFEDVVAAYSRELGYGAKTTRIGPDGGVDVHLFQGVDTHPVAVIQCKAWDAYKVGVKPVRELFGVMAADKVTNGGFFTTGEFTSEAKEWARDKPLDLVDGREFLSRIGQLPQGVQAKLIAMATEGDYTTPTCPSCGLKMLMRTARKGRSEGSGFWGCRNHPTCKRTFKFTSAT